MSFSTEKNKINKLENKQIDIDNSIEINNNPPLLKKEEITAFITPKIIVETDYTVFTTYIEDSSVSHSIPTIGAIIAYCSFTGTITTDELIIPYIHPQIVVKPLPNTKITNYLLIDTYSWANIPNTTIFLEPNKIIFQDYPHIIIGNTGATGEVVSVVNGLISGILDRKVSAYAHQEPTLILSQQTENTWSYSIAQYVMFSLETEDNVGIFHTEGEYIYTPNYSGEDIVSYDRTDARTSVHYNAYKAIAYDIEAKLILSYLPKQICNSNVVYNEKN